MNYYYYEALATWAWWHCDVLTELLVPNLQKLFLFSPAHPGNTFCITIALSRSHLCTFNTGTHAFLQNTQHCVCVCIRLSNRAMQTVSSTTTESDRGRQLLPRALWLRKQLSASYIIWCCLELFRPRVKTLLSETQRWVAQIESVTKLVKSGGARGADGLNRNACVSYTDEPIMEL